MCQLKNKKVLLVGLGVLGGGLNTALWLVKMGARLTITDLKDKDALETSLKALSRHAKKIKLVLGRHDEEDFLENDLIVVNPDVPLSSPFLKLAIAHKKQIENELTLFYKFCPSKKIVAVTGTRGKTTTTNWIGHFLKAQNKNTEIAGNSPDNPLLNAINRCKSNTPIAIETPSFLLEHVINNEFRPRVAVITNIYRDHLNRYFDMRHYALTKGNIFRWQKSSDFLVLNNDNPWTKVFIKQRPKSKVLYFSTKPLPHGKNGIFSNKDLEVILRLHGRDQSIYSAKEFANNWGEHNLKNLLAAILATFVFGVPIEKIIRNIKSLPQIKFREELVFGKGNVKIYNDTSATSPDATIAALLRFSISGTKLLLIAGGTDRNLEYSDWATIIKKYLPKENLILLNGSATKKMQKALGWKRLPVLETLDACLKEAEIISRKNNGRTVILFSPGAKSFEKFKNEYDRGRKFNLAVKQIFS